MKYLESKWDLYESENIDNENIFTVAVNPKKYFEKLKKNRDQLIKNIKVYDDAI